MEMSVFTFLEIIYAIPECNWRETYCSPRNILLT